VIVHEPVQVEIIREVPVELQVAIEVDLLKEKIVTLKEEVIREVPVEKIVEKEVVVNQVCVCVHVLDIHNDVLCTDLHARFGRHRNIK
jgi:stringent starvation protein B